MTSGRRFRASGPKGSGSRLAWLVAAVILPWAQPALLAVGGQIGLEFAIDAPWRLEPFTRSDGRTAYGPVPITVTFHDAIFDDNRRSVGEFVIDQIHVGTLVEVEVLERHADGHERTTIHPSALREIERKSWVSTQGSEPVHELCRPKDGEDCRSLLGISNTGAWHAMFWYTPRRPLAPGQDLHLRVSVKTRFGDKSRAFTNHLVVHAGEAPLPRFDRGWIYGDFHYHSQMTDNEGESGYSYGNVARTLGAMGLDFVFATDHASGGTQQLSSVTAKRCGSIAGRPCVRTKQDILQAIDRGGPLPEPDPVCPESCRRFSSDEARDLNPARFQAAKEILYGPDGVNLHLLGDARSGTLANFNSRQVLPQVYMGEEVDAWPEMSAREHGEGLIRYGEGLTYAWPDSAQCLEKEGSATCRGRYSRPYGRGADDSFLVLDQQGLPFAERAGEWADDSTDGWIDGGVVTKTLDFLGLPSTSPQNSRQHLIYFPRNDATGDSVGFVGSHTGSFGGAGRRLEDVLSDIEGQGVAFLAHPLVGRKPGGIEGPDIVPYSRHALDRAWRSPAILGLQFWNEDIRQKARLSAGNSKPVRKLGDDFVYALPFTGVAGTSPDFPWRWPTPQGPTTQKLFEELYHGAFVWDSYLRKGLADTQTSGLGWLPRGEPRKWFMAGGSDSHGDFNFRREGRPCLEQWCDAPVVDSAIGKPRNLVLIDRSTGAGTVATSGGGGAKRYGNREVIDAVAEGRFSVTDGPALRIAIDKNRNGRIDADDFQMGETFHLFPGEQVPLLVEWSSTPEFGRVQKVDVYVGVAERTYAVQKAERVFTGRPGSGTRPLGHGPRNDGNQPQGSERSYAQDPAGVLRITPQDAGSAYAGVARIFLSPKQFELDQEHGRLFYLRAFAQSEGQETCVSGKEPGSCGRRLAYANPIWGRFIGGCLDDPLAIDGDGSGRADVCERDLRNPCGGRPASTEEADRGDVNAPEEPADGSPPRRRRFSHVRDRVQTRAPGTPVATDGHPSVEKKPSPGNSCQFVEAVPATSSSAAPSTRVRRHL